VFANTTGIKISETRGGDALNLNTVAISNTLELHTVTKVINPFANGDLVLYTTTNTAVEASITGSFTTNTGVVVDSFIRVANNKFRNSDYVNVTFDSATCNTQSFNANTTVDADSANSANVFITISSHPFANGDSVLYYTDTGNTAIAGLTNNQIYYVIGTTTNTLKLATQAGNTATIANIIASSISESGHFIMRGFDGITNASSYYVMDANTTGFRLSTTGAREYTPSNITANTVGVVAADDFIKIATANSRFTAGDRVYYAVPRGNTAVTPLTGNAYYYVTFANTTGVKLATTPGGSAINITDARTTNPAEVHTLTGIPIINFKSSNTGLTLNLSQNKLTNAQSYYVVNTTPNTVKLSLTANGSPINITANGSTSGDINAGHFLTKTIEE
jgi:hypothetical protein